jgi:hypothetical protein
MTICGPKFDHPVVVLPSTSLVNARRVAEQIRQAVESKKIVKRSTGETLARAAADIADKLDFFLYERYRDIQVLARSEAFRSEDRGAKADHLNKVRAAYPVYHSLALIDPQAHVIASTDAASRDNHGVPRKRSRRY